ncbi:hypothetical protein HQ535_03585 [bacterium]|nr:hypothetical protein [bacterium]
MRVLRVMFVICLCAAGSLPAPAGGYTASDALACGGYAITVTGTTGDGSGDRSPW